MQKVKVAQLRVGALVRIPNQSKLATDYDLIGEVSKIVKRGQQIVVTYKVYKEGGFDLAEVLYLADETVSLVRDVVATGILSRLWKAIKSIFA